MAQQQEQQQSQVVNQTSSVLKQQTNLLGVSFDIDNVTFSHHMATVNGIQLHYVIGGHGDPIVLLHGWPETWHAWHKVMPALAKNYTVIAPDLRGLGDSSKPPTGYDGKTVAEDIYQLVNQLGFKTILLVGHDLGTQVAYLMSSTSYGSKEASSNGINDSRFRTSGKTAIWWGIFHQTPDVPEALVQGKELIYLSWSFTILRIIQRDNTGRYQRIR